ncbi:hypothetical protein NKG60_26705 [Mesorhizobium sp. M1428]|uniref:hypothetical protein n=1 Tax=Mesorhizobium sp. M1428 TaxID=2957102 RepID=UPI00333CE846
MLGSYFPAAVTTYPEAEGTVTARPPWSSKDCRRSLITVALLKPETRKNYVIVKDQASKNLQWIVALQYRYAAPQYLETIKISTVSRTKKR